MERKIVIVAVGVIIGCMAGCYTPNDDRCSMIYIPNEDPDLYPVTYPGIYMGRPDIHLNHLDLGHLQISGIPTK